MSPCHGEDHEFESRMFRHGLVAQGLEQAPYKGEMEVQLFPRPPFWEYGVMVAATDLKSVGISSVWVQVPLLPPIIKGGFL